MRRRITTSWALGSTFAASLLLLTTRVQADESWQERVFAGHTRYQIEQQDSGFTIRGDTEGTASVLYRKAAIDLGQTPVIRWRWKVAQTYGPDINERSRAGDDYPARLYVVVRRGIFPWQTLALNYVWSSSGRIGDSWPNAYTDKAQMLVLQAGEEKVGQWQSERRNVVADFKRYFGVEVSQLDGYAVMIDGDNSGQRGTAWFADIVFEADQVSQ